MTKVVEEIQSGHWKPALKPLCKSRFVPSASTVS
jgi:hypothetical protein